MMISNDHTNETTSTYYNNTTDNMMSSGTTNIPTRQTCVIRSDPIDICFDLKEWNKWLKILESRAELKVMWYNALRTKVDLCHINDVIKTFRNRRTLRCNRRGLSLRIKKLK
jgi:hypothetical protein